MNGCFKPFPDSLIKDFSVSCFVPLYRGRLSSELCESYINSVFTHASVEELWKWILQFPGRLIYSPLSLDNKA
jgi:hypothetical protein